MRLRSSNRRQAGDTIVEVLIVLTILSLAFSISYATATRGLAASRQAQEHSEALQFLTSQIELLRTADKDNIAFTGSNSFCMTAQNTAVAFASGYTVTPLARDDDYTKYPLACTKGPDLVGDGRNLYRLSITRGTTGNHTQFTMYARWVGPGTAGLQQEKIVYRLYP